MRRSATVSPDEGVKCIECGEKIYPNDKYFYAKSSKIGSGAFGHKGVNFIHVDCYKKMCKGWTVRKHTHTHTMKGSDGKCLSSKGT